MNYIQQLIKDRVPFIVVNIPSLSTEEITQVTGIKSLIRDKGIKAIGNCSKEDASVGQEVWVYTSNIPLEEEGERHKKTIIQWDNLVDIIKNEYAFI